MILIEALHLEKDRLLLLVVCAPYAVNLLTNSHTPLSHFLFPAPYYTRVIAHLGQKKRTKHSTPFSRGEPSRYFGRASAYAGNKHSPFVERMAQQTYTSAQLSVRLYGAHEWSTSQSKRPGYKPARGYSVKSFHVERSAVPPLFCKYITNPPTMRGVKVRSAPI